MQRVERVRVLPREFLAGIRGDFNERFHRNHASDRPQARVLQWTITLNANACAGFVIFAFEIKIGHVRTETLETAGNAFRVFYCFRISKTISCDYGCPGIRPSRGLDLLRNGDGDVGGREVIE